MKVTSETVVRPAGTPNSFVIDAEGGEVLYVISDGSTRLAIRFAPDEMLAIACSSIYVAQHIKASAAPAPLSSIIVPGGRS